MWTESNGVLSREVKTPNFLTAFQLVAALVAPAEAADHHPDIEFGWGYVRIRLTTHSAGGLTEKDRALATVYDGVIASLAR
jgi:4a-hydroxytetrahydrobiopterin dehydratase